MLNRFYEKFPSLDAQWIDFRIEMNATNDKAIFLEEYADGRLPLYKGASIWQFDALFAKPEYGLDEEQFDAHLRDKEISRIIESVYPVLSVQDRVTKEKAVLKALGLHRREELAQFVCPDRCYYRLGFRDIARDTDERTLICALLPKDVGAQHTMWMGVLKTYRFDAAAKTICVEEMPRDRMLFARALFNTIPVDWVLRFSAAIHATKSVLMRQPMPQPADVELAENPVYKEMILNSLKLSLYHNRKGFHDLQMLYGLDDKDIPTTIKQVEMLKIRNDVLVAGIYGVTKAEMKHMLKGFNVLAKKKPGYVKALIEAMGLL